MCTVGQRQDGTLEEDHRQGLGVGVEQAWDQGKESRGRRLEGNLCRKESCTLSEVRDSNATGVRRV